MDRIRRDRHPTGVYDFRWSGRDVNGDLVPPGVYLARMMVGGQVFARKIVLVR